MFHWSSLVRGVWATSSLYKITTTQPTNTRPWQQQRAGCSPLFSSSSQIFILLIMHWSITNISIPHCSLHDELCGCLCKNTLLFIRTLYLLGCRFTCITQIHVKRGIKATAASKALIVQATCNWNTTSSCKFFKIFHWVFQNFNNQGDSIWFCYSLQRSWHFRSKWNLLI